MKKIAFTLILGLTLIVLNSEIIKAEDNTVVTAELVNDNERKIQTTEYDEINAMVTENGRAVGTGLQQIRSDLIYSWTIIVTNGYKQARATSESSELIDYMEVELWTYGSAGGNLGHDLQCSPSGFKVSVYSAYVEVQDAVFDYKIASAKSRHFFQNAGYLDFEKMYEWEK